MIASEPADEESEQEKAARYLKRAAELREMAAEVTDSQGRAVLLKAAEAYEQLAGWKPDRR